MPGPGPIGNHLGSGLLDACPASSFVEANKESTTLTATYIPVLPTMSGRKDFLSQPAPENYVAGLGRGATGFTTRSDLGPAREGPTPEQIQEALAKRAALLGTAPPTAYGASTRGEKGGKADKEEDDDDRYQDPENETGLFAYGQYDRDDDEADQVYQAVDEKMDKRRKARRYVQ